VATGPAGARSPLSRSDSWSSSCWPRRPHPRRSRGSGPPDFAVDPDTAPPPDAEPTPIIDTGIDDASRVQIPPWIGAVFEAILLTAAVAALVYLAVLAWRRRPRLRWRRRRVRGDLDVVPDLAAAVAADADEQRAALRRGTPRNAIVECWLRLERAVEEAGFVRRPSDTSTELTERVLADSLVDRRALRRLAALYREARFSDHRLG
jgi:hypothetical protein